MKLSDIIQLVVGAILGCVFPWLITKFWHPLLYFRCNPVFSKAILEFPNLSVQYDGIMINNPSVITFAFWNGGKEPITGDKIVEPLLLTSTKGKFLGAELVCVTEPTNKFCALVASDNSSAQINFHYLEKNDGGIVRVLCSDTDIDTKYSFSGKIIGCRRFRDSKYKDKQDKVLTGIIYSILSFAFVIVGVLITSILISHNLFNPIICGCIGYLLAFVLIYVIVGSVQPISSQLKDSRYRMPKELKVYFDNINT